MTRTTSRRENTMDHGEHEEITAEELEEIMKCCGSCEFFVPGGIGIEGTEGLKGLCNKFDAEAEEGDGPMTDTCHSEV